MIEKRRLALSTGITMNVALAGPAGAPPVILVHGFPESHRRIELTDMAKRGFLRRVSD